MGGKNLGGRQSALEQLYLAYRQDVYHYLCSLTRNASDAEDLLSETFLRALKRLPFFRGDCSAKTWLFGIARNVWLESLRRRRPQLDLDDLIDWYLADPRHAGPRPCAAGPKGRAQPPHRLPAGGGLLLC